MLGVYDCIFKAIMLDKNNPEYLQDIIHYVTGIPKNKLKNIVIKNNEFLINNKNDKKSRSDIIIEIDKTCINLEMNKSYYEGLFAKNDAYIEKISASLYNENEDYIESKNIIQINFDNFSYFNQNKEIYKFVFKEETSDIILPENPIKYHVDLDYLYKKCYNKPIVNLSKFERYCLLLRAETKEFADKISGDDQVMKKVTSKLLALNEDEKMIGLYDAEKEAEKIMRTRIKGAEIKAREAGIKQGISQGISKGIGQEKKDIAKKMLEENLEIELISKITNLTIDEIKNLR